MLEMLNFFGSYGYIIVLCIAAVGLPYIFYFIPKGIKKQLRELTDFESDEVYSEFNTGIAIDESKQLIAYHNGRKIYRLHKSLLHEPTRNEKSHQVRVLTKCKEIPELRIDFIFRKTAQQCIISLQELYESQLPSDSRDLYESDLKIVNNLIDSLMKKGADPDIENRMVGKKRRRELVKIAADEINKLRGRSDKQDVSQGDQKLMCKALCYFIGREEDEPKTQGYTVKSLSASISDDLKIIWQ